MTELEQVEIWNFSRSDLEFHFPLCFRSYKFYSSSIHWSYFIFMVTHYTKVLKVVSYKSPPQGLPLRFQKINLIIKISSKKTMSSFLFYDL